MQGLCVSIKESEVHLHLKEYKKFSSEIEFYSLESSGIPEDKFLAENESFHYSAFGFGRRI